MMALLSALDLRSVLLAKHAQHVVLVHFPIGLFISAVGFDLVAMWTKRGGFLETAYYNLLVAAISTLPTVATGILAWHFALEGEKLKGVLLLHLAFGWASTLLIWVVWWIHFRAKRRNLALSGYRIVLEGLAVGIIAVTGHIGGLLSGVNL
jgi:uncharacterized membrane protein